jgi:hypothetical protein
LIFQIHYDSRRAVFISSLLTLWAFHPTPDPTKSLDDMGFINGVPNDPPYCIDFKTRVPEMELRGMMQNDSEVA